MKDWWCRFVETQKQAYGIGEGGKGGWYFKSSTF